MLAERADFVVGVDTHGQRHSFALIHARTGALVREWELPACAEGYREFARSASVQSYEEADVRVEVFGAAAVVSYRYDLTYVMDGESFQDTGHDLYVFQQENGRWQAVWRTLVPLLSEAATAPR